MTAALEAGEWSAARPGRILLPGKIRYPYYRRLVGPRSRSGRAEKLASPGFDPRIIQPLVSRYTDRATLPICIKETHLNLKALIVNICHRSVG